VRKQQRMDACLKRDAKAYDRSGGILPSSPVDICGHGMEDGRENVHRRIDVDEAKQVLLLTSEIRIQSSGGCSNLSRPSSNTTLCAAPMLVCTYRRTHIKVTKAVSPRDAHRCEVKIAFIIAQNEMV